MEQNTVQLVDKTLLEKLHDLLERKPGRCDVAFSVGKEKKIVKALKVILIASSPFLEKEFEEKWELAVIKEDEGIPLPDFDPTAFELFVKLTSLDTWSLETLKTLNLPQNQVLNLLSICHSFKMKTAVETLEQIAATFMRSFGEYKDTDDFLRLSQKNVKSILVSDEIGIKELDVFHSAIRWAEFQCKEMNVEPSEKYIREVLGECLFEIRFPIMTNSEFMIAMDSKDILTSEETIGIYKFMALESNKKLEFDTKKLPFKTTGRKPKQAQESEPNSNILHNTEALILPGISTLSLTRALKHPMFVCNGSENHHIISCEKKIKVFGLGFLGPIENGGFYDVKVEVEGYGGILYKSGTLEKRIFAQKGKKFYFVFDAPIDFEAGSGSISDWTTHYGIFYYLQGPNTSAVIRSHREELVLQEENTKFILEWKSNQLDEILFKLI